MFWMLEKLIHVTLVVFFTFLVLAMALVLAPWLLLFLPVLILLRERRQGTTSCRRSICQSPPEPTTRNFSAVTSKTVPDEGTSTHGVYQSRDTVGSSTVWLHI